ncbi:MAG: AAA family ATPase, partial [Actinomycetota bacterium]
IESPYVVGIPLTEEQQVFTGRSDISARIQHLLLNRHSPSLMLYGQRRMGKTSLLYNLGRLLPSTIVPVFVDLQGPPTQAEGSAGFLYHLADAMADSARRQRDLSVFVPPREAFSQDPFTRFYEWLDDFDAAIERRTALLMLDEFEALDRAFSAKRLDGDEVLSMLRHLIQHRPQFKVLLSGSHTLVEFERWASYLINVQVIKVGYLTESEARQLVERPVPDFQLQYEARASKRVLALTRCHPFLIQLLCAEIVALKNEQAPAARRRAVIEDVNDAVPPALESGALFFSDIERNQVDENALSLLRLISSRREGVVAKKKLLRKNFSGDFDSALEVLRRRELIEEARGGYRVQVELIRRWFTR